MSSPAAASAEAAEGTISSGQQQRIALGRGIVRNPAVFLFDEPLSNLDAKLRDQVRLAVPPERLHFFDPDSEAAIT